jgi:hypothetical protein
MADGTARRPTTAAILAAIGGAIAAIGSFLPWAKVSLDFARLGIPGVPSQSVNVSGTDGGDGWITIAGGAIVIIAAIGFLVAKSRGARRGFGILAIIGGLVAAGIAIYDLTQLKSSATDSLAGSSLADVGDAFKVTMAYGIFIVIAGGLLALVGGILGMRGGPEPMMAAPPPPAPGMAATPPPMAPPAPGTSATPPPMAPPAPGPGTGQAPPAP